MGHEPGNGGATSPLGELIRAERVRRGLTRKELASQLRRANPTLRTDEKTVERWELRDQRPIPAALRALAAVFRRPIEELAAPAAPRAYDAELTMDAYRLVSGAVDWRNLVPDLHQATDRLCRLYAIRSSPDLIPRVQDRVKQVQGLLNAQPRGHQRELVEIAGWLYLLLGTLYADTNSDEVAWACRDMAHRLGEEIGHGDLIGWCYETASWMALMDGLRDDMLEAAEAGLQVAPAGSSSRVQCVLKVANAHALLGELAAMERSLEEAAEIVAGMDPSERPEHHFVFDAPKLDLFASRIYAQAGEHRKAAEHAQTCIARSSDPTVPARHHPRRVTGARADLAAALLQQGELEAGCVTARQALGEGGVRSKETVRRFGGILATVRHRYRREPAMAQLVELYRGALNEYRGL